MTNKDLAECIRMVCARNGIYLNQGEPKSFIDESVPSNYWIEEIFSRVNRAYNITMSVKAVKPTPTNIRLFLNEGYCILFKLKNLYILGVKLSVDSMNIKMYIPYYEGDGHADVGVSQLMSVVDSMYAIREEKI